MEETKYCVYAHYNDQGQVFYVGVGGKRRPYQFDSDRRSEFWTRYVKKHCASEKPTVKIWHSNLTWEKACEKEKMWIALFGRRNDETGCLVNLTDGGEGCIGRVCTEETKQKIGEANRGKKPTEESKQKMASAQRGKTHSEETKRRMSEVRKGRVVHKAIEANRGKKRSPETKQKMGDAQRGKGKGYSFVKDRNKWRAIITVNNKSHHLGYFLTETEAAHAYQTALENYKSQEVQNV